MPVIGVKYAYFSGYSLGKITNISTSVNYKDLGRIQQYKRVPNTANVSLISCGYADADAVHLFNVSGVLRWCTVEFNNNVKTLKVHQLSNVTLNAPDHSAVSKQEAVTFVTYDISGRCWKYEYDTTTASSDADAKTKCMSGWSVAVE